MTTYGELPRTDVWEHLSIGDRNRQRLADRVIVVPRVFGSADPAELLLGWWVDLRARVFWRADKADQYCDSDDHDGENPGDLYR